ncbi:MAG: hypothetical protein Q9M43_05785 [Sulfurimonas sp.]|nr:hypothetical protein [Sulfurimonas sp.]
MTDNIFMISDASYSSYTKCAGLGVIDLHTNKKYSSSVCDIKDSYLAEYRALLLSVRIAIENSYDNVVFVYDNKALDLETLNVWLVDKISSYQFLWLKRAFVDSADKLARKARSLHEQLLLNKAPSLMIDEDNILKVFKLYSKRKIISAFMHIATHDELIILRAYQNNKEYPSMLVNDSSMDFYSDIYHLLSSKKGKKSFFKFIDRAYAKTIDMKKFLILKSDDYYIKIIQEIIQKLSDTNASKVRNKSVALNPMHQVNKKMDKNTVLSTIKKYSIKQMLAFCEVIGSENDKKLLHGYFNALKVEKYIIDNNGLELFMFVHSLLPKARKKNFYLFINKRLPKKKSRVEFDKTNQEGFEVSILKKILKQRC